MSTSKLLWLPYLQPPVQLKAVWYTLQVRLTFSIIVVLFSIAVLLSALSIDSAERELYVVHRSLTLPDASRITVLPTMIAIIRYDSDVSKIANKVPFGIAVCGSCRIQNKIPKLLESFVSRIKFLLIFAINCDDKEIRCKLLYCSFI